MILTRTAAEYRERNKPNKGKERARQSQRQRKVPAGQENGKFHKSDKEFVCNDKVAKAKCIPEKPRIWRISQEQQGWLSLQGPRAR